MSDPQSFADRSEITEALRRPLRLWVTSFSDPPPAWASALSGQRHRFDTLCSRRRGDVQAKQAASPPISSSASTMKPDQTSKQAESKSPPCATTSPCPIEDNGLPSLRPVAPPPNGTLLNRFFLGPIDSPCSRTHDEVASPRDLASRQKRKKPTALSGGG